MAETIDPQHASSARHSLLLPCAIVFATGFCVMVIELIASRLVCGYIGNDVYTWTSVIGVILAGMSLGNTVGGKLADRFSSRGLVTVLFLFSAGACWSILPVSRWIGDLTMPWAREGKNLQQVLVVIGACFFLPGMVLGMVTPVIAKWALDFGHATGQTVGAIYSANALGSIIGTFVTGFYLVPAFEVNRIVEIAAAGLAALGGLFAVSLLFGSRRTEMVKVVESAPPPRFGRGRVIAAEPTVGGGLWLPCVLVFGSGFCVMLVELCASRLVSVHIGQSLFTWTSVIGVILTGICLGNYIGGRLADDFPPRPLLGGLFMIASLLVLMLLQSHQLVGDATGDHLYLRGLSWGWRVFATVFGAFILTSISLGTISPVAAKWALSSGLATGSTVGAVYSWNVLGSIVGTFATGFYLISQFYVSRLLAFSAWGLAIVGLLFFLRGPIMSTVISLTWTAIAGLIAAFVCMPADRFEDAVLSWFPVNRAAISAETAKADGMTEDEWKKQIDRAVEDKERERIKKASQLLSREYEVNEWDQAPYTRKKTKYREDYEFYDESNYYTIKVSEDSVQSNVAGDEAESHSIRQLVLDALIHGYIDLEHFEYLHYEYEHIYASVSRRILETNKKENQKLRVMFLGGGSYTFPRFLLQYYPRKFDADGKVIDEGVLCDVAEIDPRVTQAVQNSLGLNQACNKRFYILKDSDKSTAAPPADRWAALKDAFFPPPKLPGDIYNETRALLQAAGAKEEDKIVKGVDYVLDIRVKKDPLMVLDAAKKLGAQIITRPELDRMMRTNPREFEGVVTHHMDARQYIMRSEHAGEYDVIFGDAFNDFSVPAHLTTLEFNQEMAKLLKPNGVFMANVIDMWHVSKFMGAYINTLEKVFKHVYLFSTEEQGVKPQESRATYVIIGSQVEVDLSKLGTRPEDIQGMVGSHMLGPMLAPVTRGGLRLLERRTITGDGGKTEFDLGRDVATVGARVSLEILESSAYSVEHAIRFTGKLPGIDGLNVSIRFDDGTNQTHRFTSSDPECWFSVTKTIDAIDRIMIEEPKGDPPTNAIVDPGPKVTKEAMSLQQFPNAGYRLVVNEKLPTYSSLVITDGTGRREEAAISGKGNWALIKHNDAIASVGVRRNATEKHANWYFDDDYRVEGKRRLIFNKAPEKGQQIEITLYSDEKIVLTDQYCPVDNMLAEVIATRIN